MSSARAEIQFWDTSAIVSLVVQEKHSAISLKARNEGTQFLAWNWMQVEAYSALIRRRMGAESLQMLRQILGLFDYVGIHPEDYPAVTKAISKHRLRSADGGHLFCLKQIKKLHSSVIFVCFDDELAKAAKSEGIHVFG